MSVQHEGVFLLRDDLSRTRRILSFSTRDAVFHVYVDVKDHGLDIGDVLPKPFKPSNMLIKKRSNHGALY